MSCFTSQQSWADDSPSLGEAQHHLIDCIWPYELLLVKYLKQFNFLARPAAESKPVAVSYNVL